MGFQEAFQLGKKYLRLSAGRKSPIRNRYSPFEGSKPGEFMGYSARGLSQKVKDNFLPMFKKKVASWGAKKKDPLMIGRKKRGSDHLEGENQPPIPKNSIDQRLLNSFPERKNAERREYSRNTEIPREDLEAEEQMAMVFFLTRKLLSKTATPLDYRLIRDDNRLERALEKVHPRLPISVRLVLRKKRYIQFMLENRERLIP